MSIALRRNALVSIAGGALPYDAEVEYLRSGTTQAYINTGIAYDGTIELEAELSINTQSSGAHAFGIYMAGSPAKRWALNKGANTTVKPFFGTVTNVTTTMSLNTFHKIKADYRYLTIDGVVADTRASSFVTDAPISIALFGRHDVNFNTQNDAVVSFLDCSFGKYTIKINGQIVQNCKPVRKDGVGYFYDSITGNLLGNANGVGAFTYGNDVNI